MSLISYNWLEGLGSQRGIPKDLKRNQEFVNGGGLMILECVRYGNRAFWNFQTQEK